MDTFTAVIIILLALCVMALSRVTSKVLARLSAQEKRLEELESRVRGLRLLVRVLGARMPEEAD